MGHATDPCAQIRRDLYCAGQLVNELQTVRKTQDLPDHRAAAGKQDWMLY
jgi:hypothetical protein